ncbi:hypothetical protein LNV09_03165 [Paucibacter sp. B2R-40]|uniref:PEP-CTERM sorting domain-containing protein n=1 Tax=Paucibacter sp. B2R-40 TaxID=2893554 RepID=UPI0021E41943|nr:PEP-CTERM sorting domain-containing protein [Paucibacter sp. B2R-40]MCV2353159.1 hypothetical protein [Paucibacter sp. B2R-40]
MKTLIRSTIVAAALAASGLAQQAQAAVFVLPALDTVTDLQISWFWNAAGGGDFYQGTHWNVEMKAALAADKWTVDVWYTHLDGPHGETPEAPHHLTGSFAASSFGTFSLAGIDDHQLPSIPVHLGAHQWGFNGSGSPFSGASALAVSHPVPEPRSAAMLAAGLAVLGLLGQRRRYRA